MSLLTHAQVCGITGEEAPLTPEDVRLTVDQAYAGERAELALAGDPQVREPDWGCGGMINDHLFLCCISDGRGLWVRIVEYRGDRQVARAGHVPWRTADEVLRHRAAEQQTLF